VAVACNHVFFTIECGLYILFIGGYQGGLDLPNILIAPLKIEILLEILIVVFIIYL
jgi:hypothetical protein